MIALLLTIFLGIPTIICFQHHEVESGLIGAGIIALAWFGHIVFVADCRAKVNRMDYWSMSGKERARARRMWEREAEEEEERESRRLAEKEIVRTRRVATEGTLGADARCVSDVGTKRSAMDDIMMTNNRGLRVEDFTCPGCRVHVRTESVIAAVDGKKVHECWCPNCGTNVRFMR